LIIWLQGIWLPLHGYSFESTPLWAGIYMVPLTIGFLLAGPLSGWLSDRYGARPFATGGMLVGAASFGLLMVLPVNFTYPAFLALLLLNGIGFGLFAAPNTTGIMNAVPAAYVTGTTFFPKLISKPFKHGLAIAFTASLLMCLVAAAASWLRGSRYVHVEEDVVAPEVEELVPA